MDYDRINLIKQTLEKEGFSAVSLEIDEIISSGSTGGEITMMVGKFLLDLIKHNVEVNKLIRNDVEEFQLYARSIGLEL